MKKKYDQWSADFKKLRECESPTQNEINRVIDYYKRYPPPPEGLRKQWLHDLGFRKNIMAGIDRGEQEIERLLLGSRGDIRTIRVEKEDQSAELIISEHNFPFAGTRKGQVISDALGYHRSRNDFRPVAIEVKVSDGTPWFAVVENLIQVRLARSNVKNIEEHGRLKVLKTSPPRRVRGSWGLVVAPRSYYDDPTMEITHRLINQLKERTRARIMLATIDKNKMECLRWFCGYWP